jgi:myo-inositol 2-dehydrogenase/D-chiro-inositol 1-dehydrogenase
MSGAVRVGVLGLGRIGAMHAELLHRRVAGARVSAVFDAEPARGAQVAARLGVDLAASAGELVARDDVDAVAICTSTDTHVELILAAAAAGKAIFCEKPIHLALDRVDACLAAVKRAGVPFQIGFNRRFDASFRAVRDGIDAGRVGKVELVVITSRDPAPDNEDYLRVSGGLFRDMTIHDFDMARFLLGEEPREVFATGSCLVDPVFAKLGDFDTVMVVLRTASGRLCHINNSVRAVYGYDQRIEVFGSSGMLRAGNRTSTSVEHSSADGIVTDKPLYFFLERYAESYAAELRSFVSCIEEGRVPAPGPEDGLRAMLLAEAALASSKSGKFEPVRAG